jgi:hypothetical protein
MKVTQTDPEKGWKTLVHQIHEHGWGIGRPTLHDQARRNHTWSKEYQNPKLSKSGNQIKKQFALPDTDQPFLDPG